MRARQRIVAVQVRPPCLHHAGVGICECRYHAQERVRSRNEIGVEHGEQFHDGEEQVPHDLHRLVRGNVVELGSSVVYGYEALLRASLPDDTPVTPECVYRAARATSWLALVEEKSRSAAFDAAAKRPISAETVFVNLDPSITSPAHTSDRYRVWCRLSSISAAPTWPKIGIFGHSRLRSPVAENREPDPRRGRNGSRRC